MAEAGRARRCTTWARSIRISIPFRSDQSTSSPILRHPPPACQRRPLVILENRTERSALASPIITIARKKMQTDAERQISRWPRMDAHAIREQVADCSCADFELRDGFERLCPAPSSATEGGRMGSDAYSPTSAENRVEFDSITRSRRRHRAYSVSSLSMPTSRDACHRISTAEVWTS